MLLVYITDTCLADARRYGMQAQLLRFKDDVEKRQTTSAFDQFPKPFFVKKKFAGQQGRLIAAEKIVKYEGVAHNIMVFLTILIRGDNEYNGPSGFGHDPEGYGKKHLLPELEALELDAFVADRLHKEPPPQKKRLSDEEQLFLANEKRIDGGSDYVMICESKGWVDEVVKSEDMLPRLKDQIFNLVDLGCDETIDGQPQLIPVAQREDFSIAYQWLDGGKRLFLYDLVKRDKEPQGAIPMDKLGHVQRYLYREYPGWMLLDDKMWNDLEKDRFGNFSLSPEESRILQPAGDEGLRFPLFINGRAGSGKSTVLQYLYADYFSRYANVGAKAGKPPAYFACNRDLIRSAVELVGSILLHNPKYCDADNAETIKAMVNDPEIFEGSFRVYHEYLLSLVPSTDRNRFFPNRRYIDYARFSKAWKDKFGRTQNASRDYGPDVSWHVIRTYIKGMSIDDFLDLDEYENIPKNQQSVSSKVFKTIFRNVWKAWYEDCTNYMTGSRCWDDQDLVRYVLNKDLLPRDGNGFLGVFCDESQDFTHIELESFLRMSVYFERSIFPHEISKLPFVFAGDPYQTLNPTGFRWEAVKAAFTEKFVFGICPIADKVRTDYFTLADLQNNYRSIPNIVRFGNSIQMLRGAKFQIPDLKPQHEWKADTARPISYFPVSDEHFWKEILNREGVHIIVPCHANEEFQFIEGDEILRKHVRIDKESGTTKPPVFSSVRAKGLEFPCVIAYGFGQSLPDAKLIDMQDKATEEERSRFLPYEYFLNRLYVAVSRPRSQLYVLDTDEGRKRLWRFAESPEALKRLQQAMPHGQYWDEHIEPLQEGTSEHLDSDFEYNPEELAESFEKTGLAENDAAMMNYAAQYYQQCKGKSEKAVECQAMGLLFNRDFSGAAKKFSEIHNYKKAGECWWECGNKVGWNAMEGLSAHDPMLRTDPKYLVARALSCGRQDGAASTMKTLLEKIRESGAEQFQSEKWVAAVTALVELAVTKDGKIPSSTMKSILELVEMGVCNSSEKFAEAMLENGDVQMARRFYEFAGVSKGARYQRTMFVTTKYPECLSYCNIEDEDTRKDVVALYLKNKDVELTENTWRYAISLAFIKANRVGEVVDVIACISDQSSLRTLAGHVTDKAWKSKIQNAADIMHLRTQSPDAIVQTAIANFENNSDVWFWLRVLARVAEGKNGRPDGKMVEKLRVSLRNLNSRWRHAPFSKEEREHILPIGEFGRVLEKFGHAEDAAGLYRWHYNLTKDPLVARRWFELQMPALRQKHGQEASRLRGEIDRFAQETGLKPICNHTAADLFGFDWESLLKESFARKEKDSEVTESEPAGDAKQPEKDSRDESGHESGVESSGQPWVAPQPTPAEPHPEKKEAVKEESTATEEPAETEGLTATEASAAEVEPAALKEPAATEEAVTGTEVVPPANPMGKPVANTLGTVSDALKLTFFTSKGRLNIEDQDSGSQWNINANGVSVDGEPKGHVTNMKVAGTGFSVTSSPTQIVLSDERCGYEFTIKL